MLTRRELLIGLASLAVVGCTGKGGGAKYRIAVIPKGLTHEFWQSIHRGAERAAGDLSAQGITTQIIWDGPRGESDANEQISIIDQKVGAGINGLVLAPQHSSQMVAPVERAVDRGIPVVIIDSNLDKATLKQKPDLIVKYVATDNYNGGKLAAEHLLATLRAAKTPAPRLLLFRYQAGSESTEQREQGFIDVVEAEIARQKSAGQPTITWVERDNIFAGAKVDTAMRAASERIVPLVKKGVDGIFAVNESATTGLVNVLRGERDLTTRPLVMGFDSSEPLLQSIRNEEVIGSIVQDPYRMGYLGVWHVVKHLEGYNVKANGQDLSTGEYLLTKANIDEPASRARFIEEAQQSRTIDTPTYPMR